MNISGIKIIVVIFVGLFSFSCAVNTHQASKQKKPIQPIQIIQDEQLVNGCEFIDEIWSKPQYTIERCKRRLLKRARRLGTTHIMFGKPQDNTNLRMGAVRIGSRTTFYMGAKIYKCTESVNGK